MMASQVEINSTQPDCSFAEELKGITRTTATGMALIIGGKVGLIQDLASRETAASTYEIAISTSTKERYVQELCASLATGGILDVTSDGKNYFLPVRKRKALLGEDPSCMNALFILNCIPALMDSEHVKKFMTVMKVDGPSGLEFTPEETLEDGMYTSSMKLEVHQMTTMLNRDLQLKSQLESGMSVLELGCNAGILSLELAGRFPSSNFCGVDIDSAAVSRAKEAMKNRKSKNISFHVQDITALPSDWLSKFDYVFAFKAIHDVSRPRDALKQTWNVLKSGGKFSLFEYNLSSNPAENMESKISPAIYLGSLLHCIPYSIGLDNGESLGAAWGIAKMKSYLEEAGFNDIQVVDPNSYPLVQVVGYK